MGKRFGGLVWLGVSALAAATLAAAFGDGWWPLELFSHFRPHLVAASFIWLFVALFCHRPFAVTAGAIMLAANAMPIVPYVTTTRTAAAADGVPLRLMTFNLHGPGTRPQALLQFIQAERPDIVLLTEVPPAHDWLRDGLAADYPHRIDATTDNSHDVMVFSRWPVIGYRTDRDTAPWLPVLAADLCAPADRSAIPRTAGQLAESGAHSGVCVRLVGLHAVGPSARFAALQRDQLARAARLARETAGRPAVLAGDLNAAPWSPVFQRLLDDGGLVAAARGHGLTATWRSRLPMIGLIIDHVLTSPDIVARHYRVGGDLGSDHLPVVADLVLPKPQAKP